MMTTKTLAVFLVFVGTLSYIHASRSELANLRRNSVDNEIPALEDHNNRELSFLPSFDALNRKCGEVIETVDAQTVTFFMSKVIEIFSGLGAAAGGAIDFTDFNGIVKQALGKEDLSYSAKYGFKVFKVCGSCEHLKDSLDTSYHLALDSFCGPDVYGSDATVSGLALIPIGETGETKQGPLMGSFWNHHVLTSPKRAKSYRWPGLLAMLPNIARHVDEVGAIMNAGMGQIAIISDYLGFGESEGYSIGPFIKNSYRTSTIPLWSATKDIVLEESGCSSELVDVASVNGNSEGGYATLAIFPALSDIGIRVTNVRSGAPVLSYVPILDFILERIASDMLPLQYVYMYPFFLGVLANHPSFSNYGVPDQSPVNEESRIRLSTFAQSGLAAEDLSVLAIAAFAITGTGASTDNIREIYNPELLSTIDSGKSVCDNPNLELLCQSFKENDVTEDVANAPYPVDICHSVADELIPFQLNSFPTNVNFTPSTFDWLSILDLSSSPPKNAYLHSFAAVPCALVFGFNNIESNDEIALDLKMPRRSKKCKMKKSGKKNKNGTKGTKKKAKSKF